MDRIMGQENHYDPHGGLSLDVFQDGFEGTRTYVREFCKTTSTTTLREFRSADGSTIINQHQLDNRLVRTGAPAPQPRAQAVYRQPPAPPTARERGLYTATTETATATPTSGTQIPPGTNVTPNEGSSSDEGPTSSSESSCSSEDEEEMGSSSESESEQVEGKFFSQLNRRNNKGSKAKKRPKHWRKALASKKKNLTKKSGRSSQKNNRKQTSPREAMSESEDDSDDDYSPEDESPSETRMDKERLAANAMGLPCPQRLQHILASAALKFVNSHVDSTSRLYGKLQDPLSGKGYAYEFAMWCKTPPGTVLNGVETKAEKQVYEVCTPTSANVYEFFEDHFLKRSQFDRKNRTYTLQIPHSRSGFQNSLKALRKMYKYQQQVYNSTRNSKDPSYEDVYGKEPNTDREISRLFREYEKEAGIVRQKTHRPRGLGSLVMEGYTAEQNQQLCEFGVSNLSLRTHTLNFTPDRLRSVHAHHVFSVAYVLRFDDRRDIHWSQFCLNEQPDCMRGISEPMLTCVLQKGKTNQTCEPRPVHAMRHLTDPYQCVYFAFAYELFGRLHIDGLKLTVHDFIPIPIMDQATGFFTGFYNHRWYDMYLMPGLTKSVRGRGSVVDPYKKTGYESCRRMFCNKVYNQIDPPLSGYHKLHLQRGQAARDAQVNGIDITQIAQHGGWNHRNSLGNHYLTGPPMEMVRMLAGYEPKIFKAEDVPINPRSLVKPPQELLDMVFPFVKEVRIYMAADPDKFPRGSECGSLRGFLDVCDLAAIIFLQDCAVLQEPSDSGMDTNRIFSVPLFQTELFKNFQQDLRYQMDLHGDTQKVPRRTEEQDKEISECKKLIKKVLGMCFRIGSSFCSWSASDPVIAEAIKENPDLLDVINKLEMTSIKTDTESSTTSAPVDLHAILTQDDSMDVSSDTEKDKESEPINYMGHMIPAALNAALHPDPAKLAADSPCDLSNKASWPKAGLVPQWARNKWLISKPSSSSDMVYEYLLGYPTPPALKDLEEAYGPKVLGVKKGESWRSHPNSKEAGKRRRHWSDRLAFYTFLDHAFEAAKNQSPTKTKEENAKLVVAKLDTYIVNNFADTIPQGLVPGMVEFPGYSVLHKTITKMRNETEGFEARSDAARERAETRNKRRKEITTKPVATPELLYPSQAPQVGNNNDSSSG